MQNSNSMIAREWGDRVAAAMNGGDLRGALRLCKEAVAELKSLQSEEEVARGLDMLGSIAHRLQDFRAAEVAYSEAIEIDKRVGNDCGASRSLHNLALVAISQGKLRDALGLLKKSVSIKERLDDKRGLVVGYYMLGNVAAQAEDIAAAKTWYSKSIAIGSEREYYASVAKAHLGLRLVLLQEGSADKAAGCTADALLCVNASRSAKVAIALGDDAQDRRSFDEADSLYNLAYDMATEHADEDVIALAAFCHGTLAVDSGKGGEARSWFWRAYQLDERLGNVDRAARGKAWLQYLDQDNG